MSRGRGSDQTVEKRSAMEILRRKCKKDRTATSRTELSTKGVWEDVNLKEKA